MGAKQIDAYFTMTTTMLMKQTEQTENESVDDKTKRDDNADKNEHLDHLLLKLLAAPKVSYVRVHFSLKTTEYSLRNRR